MKKSNLLAAALVGIATLSFQSCKGQTVNVPEAAKTAIQKAYPQVKHFTWEKENGNYEGNWNVNGKDHLALFTPNGQFVGSETEINLLELPAAAREYIAKSKKEK
jgi:filamentous hemagglutinin family protein